MKRTLLLVAALVGAAWGTGCSQCELACLAERNAYTRCGDEWGIGCRELGAGDADEFQAICAADRDALLQRLEDEALAAEQARCMEIWHRVNVGTCDERWEALIESD